MIVQAGFISSTEDFFEHQIDLQKELIEHPSATFFVRVKGDSMIGDGIHSGDTLIVDRSLPARHNAIIVAVVNGHFVVKRLIKTPRGVLLCAANKRFRPMTITTDTSFEVWGVVTTIIHRV